MVDEELVIATIEKIRPYLQYDGGDIEYVSLDEEGYVHVKMHGACAGCMSLNETLSSGVEALLLDEVPGVKGVKLVDEMFEVPNENEQ